MADKFAKVRITSAALAFIDDYILHVDKRIESLVKESRTRNNRRRLQEIERLRKVQDHMKKAFKIWLKSLYRRCGSRPLNIQAFEPRLKSIKEKEDRINEALNEFCRYDPRPDTVDAQEKERDGDSGKREIGKEERGKGTLDPDTGNSIFKGVNKERLEIEIKELVSVRDRVLKGDRILPFRMVRGREWAWGEAEQRASLRVVAACEDRGYESKVRFYFMFVFLVMLVMGNERHKEAFQEFLSRLKAVARPRTKLINKFVNMLKEADQKLNEMTNLKRMTGNIMEGYRSMTVEDNDVRVFLESLLDGMEHLDFVLQYIPFPRTKLVLSDDFFLAMDVIFRCEETVEFIAQQMWLVYGPCYDEWKREVSVFTDYSL